MAPEPPHVSGVYQIRCIPTGKIYVGSAVNISRRWYQHRRDLRQGMHGNQHLQYAWSKYGEESFEFTILEFVEKDFLLQLEQEWIHRTGCSNNSTGFNICIVASSPLGVKRSLETRRNISSARAYVWEGFIDLVGNEVVIKHLPNFCKENNLVLRMMYELTNPNSASKNHRGWTHKNSLHKINKNKVYEGFIDPDRKSVGPIESLSAFCCSRGLDTKCMRELAKGKKVSYKGWTHRNSRPRIQEHIKEYTGFINPDGQLEGVVVNLNAFCRRHGLDTSSMQHVASGRVYSYRGWTYNNGRQKLKSLPPKRIRKTYHGFVRPNGQPTTVDNLQEFCQVNGLNLTHMCSLVTGKRKSHKGWTWQEEKNDE